MDQKLLDRISQCPELPSIPMVALRVLELTESGEFELADLARVLAKDPALSSRILRTVNSSFYGNGHTVSTISQALVLLGCQPVRTLALGFSLTSGMAQSKTTAFDRRAMRGRSRLACRPALVSFCQLNG